MRAIRAGIAAGMFAALAGLAGAADLPGACEVLQKADQPSVLGPGARYATKTDQTQADMRVTMCLAEGKQGPKMVTFLLRASAGQTPDAAAQETAYVSGLGAQAGTKFKPEPVVGLGEAAIWIDALKQLTFWTDQGRLMMVLSVRSADGKAQAEALARKILAAKP